MKFTKVDALFNYLANTIQERGVKEEFYISETDRRSTRRCLYSLPVEYEYKTYEGKILNFPIQGQRYHSFNAYKAEYEWETSGGENTKDLSKYSYLWDTWANSDGSLPISYGKYWKTQLEELKSQILNNPNSTRHVLMTWGIECLNPPITDRKVMAVPPCHPTLIFTTYGGKIHLNIMSRSQDLVCGLPGDLIRYSLMLREISKITMIPMGSLHLFFCNIHMYEEHLDKYLEKVFGPIRSDTSLLPNMKLQGYPATYKEDRVSFTPNA